MKTKRTPAEIAEELAALRAIKPNGYYRALTTKCITVEIEALTEGIDETAEEFNELSFAERDAAKAALDWAAGLTDRKPSTTHE